MGIATGGLDATTLTFGGRDLGRTGGLSVVVVVTTWGAKVFGGCGEIEIEICLDTSTAVEILWTKQKLKKSTTKKRMA